MTERSHLDGLLEALKRLNDVRRFLGATHVLEPAWFNELHRDMTTAATATDAEKVEALLLAYVRAVEDKRSSIALAAGVYYNPRMWQIYGAADVIQFQLGQGRHGQWRIHLDSVGSLRRERPFEAVALLWLAHYVVRELTQQDVSGALHTLVVFGMPRDEACALAVSNAAQIQMVKQARSQL